MITPWMVYFIGILDDIAGLFKNGAVLSATVLVLGGMFSPMLADMDIMPFAKMKKMLLVALAAFAICGSLAAFTPSTKLAAAMYIIPAVANNEDMKAIGGNSLEALRKLTEQWLLDLGGGEKEKSKI